MKIDEELKALAAGLTVITFFVLVITFSVLLMCKLLGFS